MKLPNNCKYRRSPFFVALSFMRIPKLFIDIFLLPCLISFFIILIQLVITSLVIGSVSTKADTQIKNTQAVTNPLRKFLLGCEDCKLEVCRYEKSQIISGKNCEREFYDFTIYAPKPREFDLSPYLEQLNTHFKRVVICDDCEPSAIVLETSPVTEIHISSVWGLMLYANSVQDSFKKLKASRDKTEEIKGKFGSLYLHIRGMGMIKGEKLVQRLGVIANICSILVISVWLLVRAHRLILSYFARSGSLLPLVSFLGPPFYSSIWILTLMRVLIFLSPSTLAAYVVLKAEYNIEFLPFADLIEWLLALFSGFLLAGLTSSISDLKSRGNFRYIIFRYLPFLTTLIGGALWGLSLLFPLSFMVSLRSILTATPLLGLAPLILSPIFPVSKLVIAAACASNALCVYLLARANRTWFNSHLEEI